MQEEAGVTPDFNTTNETEVREIIIQPLLARLGYANGTQANILPP